MRRNNGFEDLFSGNPKTEAENLLAFAIDPADVEKLRKDIPVSSLQCIQLTKALGPAVASCIVEFREKILREFDRLARTQLAAIRACAEKNRARLAKRKIEITAEARVYQKEWEKRRRAQEAAL